MADHYHKRPSDLMDIEDSYTAFCFDEACDYIYIRIRNGDVPVFKKKVSSFHDIYKDFEKGGV